MSDIIYQVGEFIAEVHTIEEASQLFGKSTSSIKKYLAKIRDKNSPYYNEILAEKIKLAQMQIELMGRQKGGRNGKRSSSYDEKSARLLAETYIHSGLSFERMAEITGIPSSTLCDVIRGIPDAELQARIDERVNQMTPQIIEEKDMLWRK